MRLTLTDRPRAIDKIRQRRAAACGRGALLGVDAVADVVLARVVEHGEPGVTMPPGSVLLEVWGGKPPAVLEAVHVHRPAGVQVLVIHHDQAGPLQRATAWWRWTLHRVRMTLHRARRAIRRR
jgi:hypothetical protein